MEKKLKSRYFRINNFYKIIDKLGKEIIFKLNESQKELYEEQINNYKRNGKIRVVILKARQLGISTFKLIDSLDNALFYRNKNIYIIAHDRATIKTLFNKLKYTYEKIPAKILIDDGGKIWNKPMANVDNANELYFEVNNSRINVALQPRGATATDIHFSEMASVRNIEEIMQSIEPAVENGNFTIETTAQGMANYFYNFWYRTEKKEEWSNMFFPWFQDPIYQKTIGLDGFKLMEELEYLKPLNLKKEQLNWFQEKFEGDENCEQEYPTTPARAFVSSGLPVFNLSKIELIKTQKPTVDKVYGELLFFGQPEVNCYIGVDTAEGLINGDFSAITVINKNGEIIATYKGHIAPDLLPVVIDQLWCSGYNGEICIERNNHGHTVINECKKFNWFDYLYREVKTDKITLQKTKKYGILTKGSGEVTKTTMINLFRKLIREGNINIPDERLKKEMFTYYYDEKGKSNAVTPNHDDLIMSTAIALECKRVADQKGELYFATF